jgi:hypothetical protein
VVIAKIGYRSHIDLAARSVRAEFEWAALGKEGLLVYMRREIGRAVSGGEGGGGEREENVAEEEVLLRLHKKPGSLHAIYTTTHQLFKQNPTLRTT